MFKRKNHFKDGFGTTSIGHAYTYDGADRTASHAFSIAQGVPPTTATLAHAYDALGRLSSMTRPFNSSAEKDVAYTYDLHGWTTGVTTNSFCEELFYADRFSEGVQYDAHGNVTRIVRRGRTSAYAYGLMDDLTLAYDGDRVDNTDYLITSTSQQITYNPYGKAALIVEGDSSQVLFYGPDKTRWLQVDSVIGQVAAKTYYFDDFELRVAGGHTRKYHYIGEGLLTYMLDSSLTDHYYLLTDNVGSVTHIVSGEGGTKFEAGYEAWGRQHVTKNDIGFFRGYGGHEMLSKYRLVNMEQVLVLPEQPAEIYRPGRGTLWNRRSCNWCYSLRI